MFSLFNKRNKNTIHDLVSRSKYFLEKELFLKGIIHEEVFLKEEYKEVYENLPKVCHENLSHRFIRVRLGFMSNEKVVIIFEEKNERWPDGFQTKYYMINTPGVLEWVVIMKRCLLF